jgi:hypothetical protein
MFPSGLRMSWPQNQHCRCKSFRPSVVRLRWFMRVAVCVVAMLQCNSMHLLASAMARTVLGNCPVLLAISIASGKRSRNAVPRSSPALTASRSGRYRCARTASQPPANVEMTGRTNNAIGMKVFRSSVLTTDNTKSIIKCITAFRILREMEQEGPFSVG